MTIEDKINSLIGKSYDAVNYHCWHTVKDLQPNAPDIDVVATKAAGVRLMNEDNYDQWVKTDTPKDLDILLMGNREDALHHAGVYYKGLVVHNDLTTVHAEPLDTIKTKYTHLKFFTQAVK